MKNHTLATLHAIAKLNTKADINYRPSLECISLQYRGVNFNVGYGMSDCLSVTGLQVVTESYARFPDPVIVSRELLKAGESAISHMGDTIATAKGLQFSIVDAELPSPTYEHMDSDRLTFLTVEPEQFIAVARGVDKDRNQAVLGCVQINGDGLCATDGKLLMWCEDPQTCLMGEILVGGRLLKAALKLAALALKNKTQIRFISTPQTDSITVEVITEDGTIQVTGKGAGSYPNWRNAIPTQRSLDTLTLGKSFLLDVIAAHKSCNGLTTDQLGVAIFEWNNDSKALQITPMVLRTLRYSKQNALYDQATKSIRFGLNLKYLSEILKNTQDKTITLELNGPGRGVIIGRDDSNAASALLMPVTLS